MIDIAERNEMIRREVHRRGNSKPLSSRKMKDIMDTVDPDFCHDATDCVRRSTIDDMVFLETIYVAQYQTQAAYQILLQARDEHPDNPALPAAMHALFICLRATDEALEYERSAEHRDVHIGLGHVGAKQP